MTTTTIVILAVIIFIAVNGEAILMYLTAIEPDADIPHEYPIEYPLEPMFENYISIGEAIKEAETARQLNDIYVRILIFEGCYNNGAPFTSELFEAYKEKENIILS